LGFILKAALNFQKNDISLNLNTALFNDNGNCGYVLKPNILIDSSLDFDPFDTKTMRNKKKLEIEILSGQQLPQNTDIVKDISDPFVTISIFGVRDDCTECKTKTVKDNGFNPIWEEKFSFLVNCPELAFIKFTVKDEDFGKDQLIGDYTIRFQSIRQGYRHLKLRNKEMKGGLFVCIKISDYLS
jgi:hypothetical protein